MFRYAAAAAVTAAGGGTATRRSVSTWYPGLRKPSWTPALVPAVAATAAASARVDRAAGLVYAPYLAWSTYAAALNLEIWRRNRS
jgi:tryptophan-rich sensory protein